MSSRKRIQISQGKLTKQILNVVLTTEGFWDLSFTAKHVSSMYVWYPTRNKETNCSLQAISTPTLGD
jgi:hypothetical protein